MSHLTICEDSRSATSSPELASGPIPCASPDGLTINQSGPAPARASLSAQQAKEMGLLTSGTFGPTSSTSSASADLSMSLANRLQAVTQMCGSTLFNQTWKEWDTPSGLCRLRQRASARRTSESGLIGWPSPLASNVKNCYQDWLKVMARKEAGRQPNLQDFAVLTAWPTPTTESAMREKRYAQGGMPFSMAASMAGPLRLTVFGEMRTGSFVEMKNGVQLNPAHSRWLMGLLRAWDESSPGWQEWQAATASADLKAMGTL